MQAIKRLIPIVVFVFFLAGGTVLWLYRDAVQDWIVLRGYEPPEHIAQLAKDTRMTPYAERLFYVNQPTLDDKEAFNVNCAGIMAEASVLGCYRGDRGGIHIYRITDERLAGVEEVTAAHEMLHQAYDRLNPRERERINTLLQDYYEHDLDDASVREKLELYRDGGIKTLVNEMHSIFGTEIAELPPELEEYYTQYFTDRQQVVGFRQQSRAAFDEYRGQIRDFDDRLQNLQQQIDATQAALERQLADINSMREQMDRDLEADRVAEYNVQVEPFNQLVESYNGQLQQARALVDEYNQVVAERNEIAVQVTDLNAALDSRFTPQ